MKKWFSPKRYVFFLSLFAIITAGRLQAQSLLEDERKIDTAHQFLWFRGHWSANKKQFIIDKDSTAIGLAAPGGTITIGQDGSAQLKSGNTDDWNKKVDDALKIIDEWDHALENPKGVDLVSYNMDALLLPDVKKEKEEYSALKIDANQKLIDRAEQQKNGMASLVSKVSENCQKFKPTYDAIIAFWKDHKGDKDAQLSIPPPPEFEYNCYACDSNIRKVYDTTIAHYARDFFHPEDSLIRAGLGMIRSFALMGIGPAGEGVDAEFDPVLNLFHTDKKNASMSGACAYLDLYKLNDAVYGIIFHVYRRSQELLRRYRKDFRALEAIAAVSLSGAREWIMLGGNGENEIFAQLNRLVSMSLEFYYNKLNNHDWKQLANYPYMIGLLRQEALMGGENDAMFKDLLAKVSQLFNNFYLSIDMDIKIGKDGGYQLCHLKGEVKVAPEFEKKDNQCYRWVIVEDEPKLIVEGFKMPVKKAVQKIDADLLDNEIITPSPLKPVYSGTHKYYTLLKNLKMDFCNPGVDSIFLTSFVPSPNPMAGTWTIPHSPPVAMGIMGIEHFFQDVNLMKSLAESGEAEAGMEDMKRNNEELQAKMKALASQMGNGKNKDDLNKYIEIQKLAQQSQDNSNASSLSPFLNIAFKLPVENADKMVDKTFDAKEINPREAEVIVYGNYKITIEYRKPNNK